MAKQIARQACGYYADSYQIVAAIHEDKEHLHIHFVMNATNYNDGTKYRGDKKDYYGFLKHLNQIVKPYGINIRAV